MGYQLTYRDISTVLDSTVKQMLLFFRCAVIVNQNRIQSWEITAFGNIIYSLLYQMHFCRIIVRLNTRTFLGINSRLIFKTPTNINFKRNSYSSFEKVSYKSVKQHQCWEVNPNLEFPR